MKTWTPNIRVLELCITYRCNVKCDNCSNLCTQAPMDDSGDLTYDEIESMIRESADCGYQWGQISLHGGEPLLHPEVLAIGHLLVDYRRVHSPGLALQALTNWSTEKIRVVGDSLRSMGINLGISEKHVRNQMANGSPIPYVPVNESPEDLGLSHDGGCFQTENCGICRNYLGFWPCSPMAAAARVFGYTTPILRVNDIAVDGMRDLLPMHCKHCGFSMPDRPRVIDQISTKTWTEGFKQYQEVA
jgi:hypothetical protein